MTPNPQIVVSTSPDGRRMHISEYAHLVGDLERMTDLKSKAQKLHAEIKAIDQLLGGLSMTPKRFRPARLAGLLVTRNEKVKAYEKLQKEFQNIPDSK